MATTSLSQLVTAEELRALLGVSSKELKDATIDLPIYWKQVKVELNAISSSLLTTYDGLPDSGLSDAQQRLKDAVETFAGLSAAVMLAASLPQFSPRTISDGKATMQRQLDAPDKTLENLQRLYSVAHDEVDAAYRDVAGATPTTFTFPFGVSTPTTDPVTG